MKFNGLNIVLLPLWGLYGAVVATGVSTFICLAILLLISRQHGLKLDQGVWLLVALPATLPAGPVVAIAVWVVLLPLMVQTNLIFSNQEHVKLRKLLRAAIEKSSSFVRLRTPTTDPSSS